MPDAEKKMPNQLMKIKIRKLVNNIEHEEISIGKYEKKQCQSTTLRMKNKSNASSDYNLTSLSYLLSPLNRLRLSVHENDKN